MPSYVRPGIRKCAKNRALSLTREKLENDQSSNAEPLSGKPYGLPVGEGSGYAATDP